MRESEAAESRRVEAIVSPQLRELARRRLGRLADYAAALAADATTESPEVIVARLTDVHVELGDIIAVISAADGETPDDLPQGPRTLEPKTSTRISMEEFPDTPFYTGIIPGGEFATVEAWQPDQAVHLYVISDHHIYCVETGHVSEAIKGDDLFMLNTFLANQQRPLATAAHRKLGFRESQNDGATRVRFRTSIRALRGLMSMVVPDDFEPIIEEGTAPYLTRMLNPNTIVEDRRGDEAFAHLVPEATELNDGSLEDMPPGFARLAAIMRAARSYGAMYPSTAEAIAALRSAGLNPQKLNISAKRADGVWCVQEQAGLRALLAAKGLSLNDVSEAPVTEVIIAEDRRGGPEVKVRAVVVEVVDADLEVGDGELSLASMGNTLEHIIAYVNATEPTAAEQPFTLHDIQVARDTIETGVIDATSFDSGKFSYYASRKLIEALLRGRAA